jgi:hypothetical protein
MQPAPDEHVIETDDAGGMYYSAKCSCGWRTGSDNGDDRDEDVRQHEVEELGESSEVYLEDFEA